MRSAPHKDAPAFDFYPERWIAGTMGMTDMEELCYFRLLIHSWLSDGLPPEVAHLCRLARMKKVPDAVLEKFPVWGDGKRRNTKLEHERQKQRERIAKKRSGANKTNAKRWGERVDNESLSDQIATVVRVDNESPPPTSHLPPLRTAIPTRATGLPDSVEQAIAMADGAGVPADYAETIFLEHEGSTWEDGQGRPINNFASYIKARYTNRTNKLAREEKRYGNRAHGAAANGVPTANTVYQVQQQIDSINDSISEIDASVTGAWGELSAAKKAERRKLVERRTELKRKLSGLEATN